MQRMSRGPDHWQLNAHGFHSLNNVTTLVKRARFIFFEEIHMIFFEKSFLLFRRCPSSQNSVIKYFLEMDLFEVFSVWSKDTWKSKYVPSSKKVKKKLFLFF